MISLLRLAALKVAAGHHGGSVPGPKMAQGRYLHVQHVKAAWLVVAVSQRQAGIKEEREDLTHCWGNQSPSACRIPQPETEKAKIFTPSGASVGF